MVRYAHSSADCSVGLPAVLQPLPFALETAGMEPLSIVTKFSPKVMLRSAAVLENILVIDIALLVSQADRSRAVKPLAPLNIFAIFVTRLVSQPNTSSEVKPLVL